MLQLSQTLKAHKICWRYQSLLAIFTNQQQGHQNKTGFNVTTLHQVTLHSFEHPPVTGLKLVNNNRMFALSSFYNLYCIHPFVFLFRVYDTITSLTFWRCLEESTRYIWCSSIATTQSLMNWKHIREGMLYHLFLLPCDILIQQELMIWWCWWL